MDRQTYLPAPALISPADAARLIRYTPASYTNRAIDIANAVASTDQGKSFAAYGPMTYLYFQMGAIYAAGRIQGIREERQRKSTRSV